LAEAIDDSALGPIVGALQLGNEQMNPARSASPRLTGTVKSARLPIALCFILKSGHLGYHNPRFILKARVARARHSVQNTPCPRTIA
jgi:hypothetical protein